MNILNLCYFSQSELMRGIEAATASVIEGGFWIVGRTRERSTANDVTIFRKRNAAMTPVARVGDGSEIEALVARSNGKSKPAATH